MSISHQDVKSAHEILYSSEWNKTHTLVGLPTLIQTQTVAGSPVQDVTFSSLNGDVDIIYLMLFRIQNAYNGVTNIFLYPNNLATNHADYYHFYGASHSFGSGSARGFPIGYLSALNVWEVGELMMFAKTGMARFYVLDAYRTGSLGNTNRSSHWSDTSTNVTSLVVHADRAGGIAVGSTINLFKLAT